METCRNTMNIGIRILLFGIHIYNLVTASDYMKMRPSMIEQKYVTITDKTKIIDNFLHIPNKFKDKYQSKDKHYWIYRLYEKNDKTKKPIYIGKATDIRRRAAQYYLFTSTDQFYKQRNRKIIIYIHDKGIENFKMEPIYCLDDDEGAINMEVKYIEKYDTIANGFNANTVSITSNANIDRSGITPPKQTASGKRSKSKLFFIINPVEKKGYICTGLKLAGDILGGISKDNIKTPARRGIPRKGYFMYYLNFVDFENVKTAVKTKIKNGHFNGPKNSVEMGHNKEEYEGTYNKFLQYGKYIKTYLRTLENPENIDIKFVTQDDESDDGYIIIDPTEFVKEYSTYSYKIYNGIPTFLEEEQALL